MAFYLRLEPEIEERLIKEAIKEFRDPKAQVALIVRQWLDHKVGETKCNNQ